MQEPTDLYNITGNGSVCALWKLILGTFLFIHSFSPFKPREFPAVSALLLQI